MTTIPKHVNPNDGMVATAPYNFVRLPEKVFEVEAHPEWSRFSPPLWRSHDRFVEGAHSGWIDIRLKARTPLFIGNERDDGRRSVSVRRDASGRPCIPGSSLRGMTRALVEVLSFSKPCFITGERPFFRSLANDRLGRQYRNRMVREESRPQAGFLQRNPSGWTIRPVHCARVSHKLLQTTFGRAFGYRVNPSYAPNPELHNSDVFVIVEDGKVQQLETKSRGGLQKATLILTGSAPGKKHEFVFCGSAGEAVSVPESVVRRFLSEDQLTQWQAERFPQGSNRDRAGGLKDGEPVFFIKGDVFLADMDNNPEGLFFGRAGMFRLPYMRSPRELVPKHIRTAGLDMAEALFGTVEAARGADGESSAIRGRLQFEDLTSVADEPRMMPPAEVLLSSPKITCYPHYLTQDGPKGQGGLTSYLAGDKTTIRGSKFYWHVRSLRADRGGIASQRTRMESPVAMGTEFHGRVRFENLNAIELGALLSALRLPEGCEHRLGMAKSMGYGSVHIDATLHRMDRRKRYQKWEEDGQTGSADDGAQFIEAFQKTVYDHAAASRETMIPTETGLRAVARLDVLFQMLSCPGPEPSRTQTMELDQFRKKEILPTPHQIANKPEPLWPSAPPKSAGSSRPTGGNGTTGNRASANGNSRRGYPEVRRNERRTNGQPPAPVRPEANHESLVQCRVLEEKTRKGGYCFDIIGQGQKGCFHPDSKQPPHLEPGQIVNMRVRTREKPFCKLQWIGPEAPSRKAK